jgi:ABC-type multidrug transport system ATPase subunit
MKIKLTGAGKRFNREWIFRKASLEFEQGRAYAITGANGSGKSTLLQCLGGMLQLSEGQMLYEVRSTKYKDSNGLETLPSEKAYQHISFCAPYLDVIEEMTLLEFLQFHSRFKPFLPSLDAKKIILLLGLEAAAHKQIRNFSSGMKQRVKLAQCILSDTSVVLLDEPCSNLDTKGIELYHNLIETFCKDRLVIVCSNDPVEYRFCEERVSIHDYK